MSLFSDQYLDNLLRRSEIEISQQVPCILTRFSLNITQGTSVYDLPSGIINMIRVTWKGDSLEPWEHSDTRDTNWMKPQNQSSQGVPKFYLSYQYGFSKIKFHPVPNEAIASDDTNIFGSDIANRVILTAFRIADPTGSTYRIPEALRQRFGKYYVLYKAYQREGKGQNLAAAQYFKNKHEVAVSQFKKVVDKVPAAIHVHLGQTQGRRSNKPARPSLPSSGAWGW